MRDDLKDRIKSTFSAAPVPPGVLLDDDEDAAERFVQTFLARADRVVVPAMREIGRAIEGHGRFFSIERIGERITCRGLLVPTSVQMNVFRRQRSSNYKNACPHFNVICDKRQRRVVFQRTTMRAGSGAVSETCGHSPLDRLTRDVVQERLVATLDLLLAG